MHWEVYLSSGTASQPLWTPASHIPSYVKEQVHEIGAVAQEKNKQLEQELKTKNSLGCIP